MKEYKIYKLTFPDGKIYIGQTKRELSQRCTPGEYRYNEELYNAFIKYGTDNIIKEVLETVETQEEAESIEANYIKEYDSTNKNKGYNKAIRGSSTFVEEEDVLKKWGEGKSTGVIANELGVGRHTIGLILSKNNIDVKERCKRGRCRRVIQYNLSGEIIKIYDSLTEAMSNTGADITHISMCCKGTQKTSGGYIWRYADEAKNETEINKKI